MMFQYFLAAFVLLNITYAQPIPDSTTEALVVVGEDTSKINKETKKEIHPPQLKSLNVVSNVRNRYARTVVTSKYANPDSHPQEATFSIVLPETAFIAGFVMEIEGKKYEAHVNEKQEAKREYDEAIAQGVGAAHVAVSARDSNQFTVSVNVEPQSKVIFNLTYEELLVRKHGKYEMVVNLHPGQLIKDLKVDVNINETRPIINVETPALRSGNEITADSPRNEFSTVNKEKDGTVHVSFHPTVDQQKQLAKALNKEDDKIEGISGQFIVQYEVQKDPSGGEVLVHDGYFVHFFAPSELKPIPKHVIFVLDVSGSMYGRKIEQLREAMKIILDELNPEDYFNLVKFHDTVHVLDSNNLWQHIKTPVESELPQGIKATKENIQNVQKVVKNMTDEESTNIYDALVVGSRLASKGVSKETDNKHKPQPIIIFLTDGQANTGPSTDSEEMVKVVVDRNNQKTKTAVFTLGFGDYANDEFLKELAIKNSGFNRKIYEAADASLQLQDFYKQISSPLLTNINFKYSEDKVKDLTKHDFDILFDGSEFVVAGKIEEQPDTFGSVQAFTFEGEQEFTPTSCIFPIQKPYPEFKREYGSLERLWAYLTIKQLLDKKYEQKQSETNVTSEEAPEKQALKLALKYSFVTPVTSLVVVKPNQTESTANTDKATGVQSGSGFGEYDLLSAPRSGGALYHSFVEFDSDALPDSLVQNRFESDIEFEQTTDDKPVWLEHTTDDKPVWLQQFISTGKLTIDNKDYEIGNNETTVEQKACQVNSLNISGNCTLLTVCPKVYSQLDSLETYKTYFCDLNSGKYAGVCCPDSKEN